MGLDEWRARIDEIDRQLLRLLSQRAELSLEIGRAKRESGEPVLVPEREQEILDELARLNPGPLSAGAIRSIWSEVLSASRCLQRPFRVAYLGPQGTNTHLAALRHFGSSAEFLPGARHSRGVRGGRARPGGRRSRADRELERGRGEPHARRADRLGAPDLRRGVARDSPQPPLPRRRPRRRQARLLASAGPGPVPRLAQPAPAGRRGGGDGVDVDGGRAGRARRLHGGGGERAGRPAVPRPGAPRAHRGLREQRHPVPRDRRAGPPAGRDGTRPRSCSRSATRWARSTGSWSRSRARA